MVVLSMLCLWLCVATVILAATCSSEPLTGVVHIRSVSPRSHPTRRERNGATALAKRWNPRTNDRMTYMRAAPYNNQVPQPDRSAIPSTAASPPTFLAQTAYVLFELLPDCPPASLDDPAFPTDPASFSSALQMPDPHGSGERMVFANQRCVPMETGFWLMATQLPPMPESMSVNAAASDSLPLTFPSAFGENRTRIQWFTDSNCTHPLSSAVDAPADTTNANSGNTVDEILGLMPATGDWDQKPVCYPSDTTTTAAFSTPWKSVRQWGWLWTDATGNNTVLWRWIHASTSSLDYSQMVY